MTKPRSRIFNFNKLKAYIFLSFFLLLLIKCSYDIYDGNKMRDSLKYNTKNIIYAKVIVEKHYFGNSPVSHENSFKYKFFVDNIEYVGACDKASYQPGDSIKIVYVIENPKYNCPVGIY